MERVDKMWRPQKPMVGWVDLGQKKGRGEFLDTRIRDVGAERQIKKKVQTRGNGEGAKGTCWAPAPGVGGFRGIL